MDNKIGGLARKEISIARLAVLVGGKVAGAPNKKVKISGTCAIDYYVENRVSFVKNRKYGKMLAKLHKAVVLIPGSMADLCEKFPHNIYITVENVLDSMMDIQDFFYGGQVPVLEEGISATAKIGSGARISDHVYIGENVNIGSNVTIGEGARIMHNCTLFDNVVIGDRTYLYPGVCIYSKSQLGDDCTIHAGACIGVDGFRFEQNIEHKAVRKWIHCGKVSIGNRVEIGPNATIQRATYENTSTTVADDVKIDAHVHIGHNDTIGARTVVAAQTCVCGSVITGEDCWIGAGVTIAQGVVIGSRARVLINAVVAHDIAAGEVVSGFYAMPHRQWKQAWMNLRGRTGGNSAQQK